MAKKPLPTPEVLRQLLTYDPETGTLTWKPRPVVAFAEGNCGAENVCSTWNKRYAGTEAGTASERFGYRIIGLGGRLLGAHRIAWAIHHGYWAEKPIDHINGNSIDNRIQNLREVTAQQNQRNCHRRSDNKSGVTGVSRAPRGRGWVAKIRVDGIQRHLGTFETIEAAAFARQQANVRFGFSERHGSVR